MKKVKKTNRTVTLNDVRKALRRSPFPRQYDELLPLVFICEELVTRPLVRSPRPVVDAKALEGADLDPLKYASDAHSGTEASLKTPTVLGRIAKLARQIPKATPFESARLAQEILTVGKGIGRRPGYRRDAVSAGWQCPGCGACYSPFVQACWICRPRMATSDRVSIPCGGCGKIPCDLSTTGCRPAPASHTVIV